MPNPYLVRLNEQYRSLQTTIEGIQTRAANENRDLTEEETRSVTEQIGQARTLATQIEQLSEYETRSAAVGQLAAQHAGNGQQQTREGQGSEEDRSGWQRLTGNAQTRERDPGHYRNPKEGGNHSFFADAFHARSYSHRGATQRLTEHFRSVGYTDEQTRATLTTGSNGPGLIVPHWLTDEYQKINYQKRVVANAVRPMPLNGDPRPLTLPKQTAGTSGPWVSRPTRATPRRTATPTTATWTPSRRSRTSVSRWSVGSSSTCPIPRWTV